MTTKGGPALDITLFGRYFLDLSILYPGAFLCLAPLWEHLKAPRRTALLKDLLFPVGLEQIIEGVDGKCIPHILRL